MLDISLSRINMGVDNRCQYLTSQTSHLRACLNVGQTAATPSPPLVQTSNSSLSSFDAGISRLARAGRDSAQVGSARPVGHSLNHAKLAKTILANHQGTTGHSGLSLESLARSLFRVPVSRSLTGPYDNFKYVWTFLSIPPPLQRSVQCGTSTAQ